MATKLDRNNFAALLTPVHRKVFFDTYKTREKQYTKIFKVDEKHRQELIDHGIDPESGL